LSEASEIIDAQVHTWSSRDDPLYPWDPAFGPSALPETEPVGKVIADMDRVGVDAAIVTAPSFYGSDNSYAIDAARAHPERLAVVAYPNWNSSDPLRELRELMKEPTVIGIRLTTMGDAGPWGADGVYASTLAAAEELGVPVAVFLGSPAILGVLDQVARRHPELRVVVDHLGLDAPPYVVPDPGPEPFRPLPDLLRLAEHPNVFVKLTAVPALSKEPYPFRDVWEPIAKVVSTFGAKRVMWGTDYNRTAPLHTYREAVDYLAEVDLLDETAKETIYSRTVRAVFDWPPELPTRSGVEPEVKEGTPWRQ
jgi:L-fuconolactonase